MDMPEPFYVGAYWAARSESSGECSERLFSCLNQLGEAHPALARWFRLGKTRSAASRPPVSTDRDTLEGLLLGGRNRTDFGEEIIEELGFSVSLWNSNPIPVGFSVLCGATPSTHHILNHFVLNLPEPVGPATSLYAPETAMAMFHTIIAAWDPQWATFVTRAMRASQGENSGRPVAGWLTYISNNSTPVVSSPEIGSEEFADGIIMSAGSDPLRVSEVQFSAAVRSVSPVASE